MFYVRIDDERWSVCHGKVFEVNHINKEKGNIITKATKDYRPMVFKLGMYEIATKKDFDECWKEPEKMIEIKGKKYSESTVLEALKQYVNS